LTGYDSRLRLAPEAATSEAIVFSLLRSLGDEVKIAEDLDTGGPDFLCTVGERSFVVEVTAIESETVSAQADHSPESEVGSFRLISHTLRTKISSKVGQVSGTGVPSVVVVASSSSFGSAVLGIDAAENLLTSETKIAVQVGGSGDASLETDLAESVFFRHNNGQIELCRQSVSAVVLLRYNENQVFAAGALHPAPTHKFPIELLGNIPFCRLVKWPIENGEIEIEWVVSKPSSAAIVVQPVVLRDDELKDI